MRAKLTKRTVEAASADPQRDVFLWDTDLHGFGLRVKPSGVKAFVIQYRPSGARYARRFTLANTGTVTVEEARQIARLKLAEVVRGGDPAARKAEARHETTVRELVERFEREHVVHLKPSTQREYRRVIAEHIRPAFGSRRITDVSRADVAKLHHKLASHPSQANKVLAVIGKIFSFAELMGLRPDGTNPCRHLKKYGESKRERYLSSAELLRLGKAITDLEAIGREKPREGITSFVALLFRLLLVTGCRVSEITTLRWEYVDLERGLLLLPDSKTGQKSVILSDVAIDLLRQAPHREGSPWVISGARRDWKGEWTHYANPSKAWVKIKAEAGRHKEGAPDVDISGVRIHDLRHGFASTGAATGVGLQVVGLLLGQTQVSTTQRYSHLSDSPLRAAANLIAGEVWARMNGASLTEVVPTAH